MTSQVDPWHRFRTLKRATVIGISVFFLTSIPIVLGRVEMRPRAVYLPAVYTVTFGWMIFVLVMIILTHEIRCPRCGQRFYVKKEVFWQMATKCLRAAKVPGCGRASKASWSVSVMGMLRHPTFQRVRNRSLTFWATIPA